MPFYRCIAVHGVNVLIICHAQNTSILMKALNCKRKFKPITTERQFHNTGSWHGAQDGNTARLVDWKVPSAIWNVSLHLQGSQKEKNSLLDTLQLVQHGHSFFFNPVSNYLWFSSWNKHSKIRKCVILWVLKEIWLCYLTPIDILSDSSEYPTC